MLNLKTPLIFIFSLFFPLVSFAQFSILTINLERTFYDWRDSGINCDDNKDSYWYVLHEEMNDEIRKEVRLCGGSVLYVGNRNELHLYNQAISISCDSVTTLLKLDSNFINVLPLVVDEKVSYEIYSDSGLYYVDSVNLIFKAKIVFVSSPTTEDIESLKSCVDSIEIAGSNIWAYGNRDAIYCIAQNVNVKNVYDVEKEVQMNCIKSSYRFEENNISLLKHEYTRYNLNGRVISINNHVPGIHLFNGKFRIVELNNKSMKTGAEKNQFK